MNSKDELKQIVIHEAKSHYHKIRLILSLGDKCREIVVKNGKFLGRYIKELKK